MTTLNLYDANGKVIGRIVPRDNGDLILEDRNGVVKGSYVKSLNKVLDRNGRTVARGGSEMLASLLHV